MTLDLDWPHRESFEPKMRLLDAQPDGIESSSEVPPLRVSDQAAVAIADRLAAHGKEERKLLHVAERDVSLAQVTLIITFRAVHARDVGAIGKGFAHVLQLAIYF